MTAPAWYALIVVGVLAALAAWAVLPRVIYWLGDRSEAREQADEPPATLAWVDGTGVRVELCWRRDDRDLRDVRLGVGSLSHAEYCARVLDATPDGEPALLSATNDAGVTGAVVVPADAVPQARARRTTRRGVAPVRGMQAAETAQRGGQAHGEAVVNAGEMPTLADCPADLPAALDRAVARLAAPLRVCVVQLPCCDLAYVGVAGAFAVGSQRGDLLRRLGAKVRARLASQAEHDAALLAALAGEEG